uniref:DUF4381 domain-containing protein n=1 Tax=Magnetococcus massalia (strain MO-1) TaxID=451514 RepID=A0A1S7LG81_MAGMO|nr:protein of unknown function [Candidatus Magnetococcus massalia]
MTPDALLARMRDIREIDAIPIGPSSLELAATGLLFLLLLLIGFFGYRRFRQWQSQPRYGWRHDALRQFKALSRQVTNQPGKKSAQQLSELLRRVAIARCGRDGCAGLQGEAWLRWLTANDPYGFNWLHEGKPLLTLPYAPDHMQIEPQQLRTLIDAATTWAQHPEGCSHAQPQGQHA